MGRKKLNKTVKTVSLSDVTINQIMAMSERYSTTMSQVIEMAVDEYYRKRVKEW